MAAAVIYTLDTQQRLQKKKQCTFTSAVIHMPTLGPQPTSFLAVASSAARDSCAAAAATACRDEKNSRGTSLSLARQRCDAAADSASEAGVAQESEPAVTNRAGWLKQLEGKPSHNNHPPCPPQQQRSPAAAPSPCTWRAAWRGPPRPARGGRAGKQPELCKHMGQQHSSPCTQPVWLCLPPATCASSCRGMFAACQPCVAWHSHHS